MLKQLRNALVDQLPRSLIVRRGRRSVAAVALTFDDGPFAETPALLEALEKADVRATFFVVGEQCAKFPAAVSAIARAGHEVASHGYSHTIFPELTGLELRRELAALIGPPTARRPLVRPPRGAVDAGSMLRTWAAGYRTALWTLDSDDCRSTDPRWISSRAAAAGPGDVILLHEGQTWTIAAVPALVSELRARGLSLVTMSELVDQR